MLAHLIELRRRLLLSLICFGFCFLLFFFYATPLFNALSQPLRQVLPAGSQLIATEITTSFITPLKLAFYAALLASMPFFLYQAWCFIAPGLYREERLQFRILMSLSTLLFIAGLMFSYFIAMPLLFQFFAKALPSTVRLMPDMALSLDFILYMMLLFGLCFQVPLICTILAKMKFISTEQLQYYRPYVIVAAFILGMLLTPPDVISQLILAIPLCLLYELGILLVRLQPSPKRAASTPERQ